MSWPKHAREKSAFKKGNKTAKLGGRPKDTPEKKIQRKALLDYYKTYLESGQAIEDFKRIRVKRPEFAVKEATDRVHGTPKQTVEHQGSFSLIISGRDNDHGND